MLADDAYVELPLLVPLFGLEVRDGKALSMVVVCDRGGNAVIRDAGGQRSSSRRYAKGRHVAAAEFATKRCRRS